MTFMMRFYQYSYQVPTSQHGVPSKEELIDQENINSCPHRRQRYVSVQCGYLFIQSETFEHNRSKNKRSLMRFTFILTHVSSDR